MAAPFAVTKPSSDEHLINSSSRRFDGKSRSLDDRDYVVDRCNNKVDEAVATSYDVKNPTLIRRFFDVCVTLNIS